MFIDCHVHTIYFPKDYYYPRSDGQTYATPEQLLEGYDAIGVERAVVLPEVTPEGIHGVQSNAEILAVCEKYPNRFIPFCNVDPRHIDNSPWTNLGDMMKYFRDKGCKGVGEATANLRILDPLIQNLFKCAEEAEMPITFHLSPYEKCNYGLVDDPGLPQLETSLQRFPNLKFFGHSQMFWAEIGKIKSMGERFGYPTGPVEPGRVVELMRKYGNLYGDLSAGSGCNALARDRVFAAQFLNEFQDRLMFGTDICQPTMPTLRPLANLLLDMRAKGEISETVFQKVARENVIRLLGL